jgi:hypothetical protein
VAQGEIFWGELAVAAAEDREESKQVQQGRWLLSAPKRDRQRSHPAEHQ